MLQSCTGSAPSCSYKSRGPEGTRLQLPGQFQTVTLATTDSPLDRDRCSLLAANAAAAAAAARSPLIGRSSRLRCCLLCKPLGLDAVELDLLVDVPRIIDRLAPPRDCMESNPGLDLKVQGWHLADETSPCPPNWGFQIEGPSMPKWAKHPCHTTDSAGSPVTQLTR